MSTIQSPETYAQMSEPFENKEEFLEAAEGFFKELYALRCKYGLRDVSYGIMADISKAEGRADTVFISGHIGSQELQLPMVASMLGQARAIADRKREDLILKTVEDSYADVTNQLDHEEPKERP